MPDAPQPEPVAEAKPDALMIPKSFKVGKTQHDRLDSICTFAEKILGGDRSKKITAHVRDQRNGKMFVTLDPNDMIRFPSIGPNKGPRYYWTPKPDGVEYGYLVDAAKKEKKGA